MNRLSFDIWVYNRCMPSSFRGVYPKIEPVPECKVTFTIPGTNRTVEGVTTNKYGHAKVALKPGGYNLKVEPKATIRQRSQRTPPRDWPSFPAKTARATTDPNRIWLIRSQAAHQPMVLVRVLGGPGKPLSVILGLFPHDFTATGNKLLIGLQPLWMRSPNRYKHFQRPKNLRYVVIHHTTGNRASQAMTRFMNPWKHITVIRKSKESAKRLHGRLRSTPWIYRHKPHPHDCKEVGGVWRVRGWKRDASAHYLIDANGQVIKMVHEDDGAIHASPRNGDSIGIEIVHSTGHFKPEQYRALIKLLAQICQAHRQIPAHGIVGHKEVATTKCPSWYFDWVELEKAGLGLLGPWVKPILTGPDAWFPDMYDKFFSRKPRGSKLRQGIRGEAVRQLKSDLRSIGYYVSPRSGDRFDQSTTNAVLRFQRHFFGGKTRGPWIGLTDWRSDDRVEKQFKAYPYRGQVDQLTAAMIKYVALPHDDKVGLSGKSRSHIGRLLQGSHARMHLLGLPYAKGSTRMTAQDSEQAILSRPSGHKETAQGVVDGGLSAEAPAPAAPSATEPVHVHPCSQRSRGFYRYGGGRLDKKLRDMRQRGKITITDRDIATLQRIANVEIVGQVRGVWNCDNQILSFGFMQWTVTWGLLQQVIARAPAAFKDYGIELDPGRTYRFKGGRVPAIKGVTDPEKQLRQRDWVARFYRAGLHEKVIAAEVAQAMAKLKKVDARIKRVLGPQVWNLYFSGDRRDAIIARATLVELYNHRPKYLENVLDKMRAKLDAVAQKGALLDDAGFKAILDKAMVERYKPQERWQARRIIRKISEN